MPPTTLVVRDAGAPLTAGTGCTAVEGGVSCTVMRDAPDFVAFLGDRDDRSSADGSIDAGSGDDRLAGAGTLTGGPGADVLIARGPVRFLDAGTRVVAAVSVPPRPASVRLNALGRRLLRARRRLTV